MTDSEYLEIVKTLNNPEIKENLSKHTTLSKLISRTQYQLNDDNPEDASVNMRKSIEHIVKQYQ